MKRRPIADLIALCLSGGLPCAVFGQSVVNKSEGLELPADYLAGVSPFNLKSIPAGSAPSDPIANDEPSKGRRRYERTGAVAIALTGTGHTYRVLQDGTFEISSVQAADAKSDLSDTAIRLAQAGPAGTPSESPSTKPQGASATKSEADELDEIVVRGVARSYLPDDQTSATELQMRLVETPQSISVLTQEMLNIAGATNAYQAVDLVPGAEKSGVGLGRGYILLRGQVVGPRINGVKLFNFPDGFAIERTEFVRGPTTVLYGDTGDFGGEVNSILKKPLEQYRAEVGVRAGYFDSRRVEGDLTGPLSQDGRLSFRVLAAYDKTATPVRGLGINDISRMAYGALAYELTPDTRFSVNYYWDHKTLDPGDEGCPLVQDSNGKLQLPTKIPVSLYYCGGPGAHENITQSFGIVGLEHKFTNEWQFKASAARTRSTYEFSYMYPFGPIGAGNLGPGNAYLYTYDRGDHAAELTFNTSLNGDFDLFSRKQKFALGVEVDDTPGHNRRTFLQSLGVGIINVYDNSLTTLADGSPIPSVDRSKLPVASDSISGVKNYKFSAQTLLNPIEKFDVLAGVLVQHSDLFQQRLVPLKSAIKTPLTQVIPRLGLTYQVANGGAALDDARVYFSYSKGFSPNVGAFDKNGDALTAPQLMTQYEVGIKSEFFKGLVSTNLSAYTSKITNVVQEVFVQGQFDQGYSQLSGASRFKGIEAEALGEILPGWNIALSYGYTKTKLEDSSFPGLDLQVRSVPKNRATLFSSYEFLRGPLKQLRLGGGVIYKSDYPFVDVSPHEVATYGQLVASGYTRVDFDVSYAGFRSSLGGLEVYAHLENAFDARYYLDLYGYASLGVNHGPPRTLTMGLRYIFDRNHRGGKVFGGASD